MQAQGGGRAPEYPTDEASWGKFHSKRFQLTVPLPDGRAWKIDDHREPDLVAVHPPTDSRLTLTVTREPELMNRQRCEERARARGWIPKGPLSTVDDQVEQVQAHDARVWLAIDRGGTALEGHVFLFAASLRQCLLVHLTTRVPPNDEAVLASRLAVGSARIVGAIQLDARRVTEEGTVPRDKPESRR